MMCLGNGRRREGMTAGLLFVPIGQGVGRDLP